MLANFFRYGIYVGLHKINTFYQKIKRKLSDSGEPVTEPFQLTYMKKVASELGIRVESLGFGAYEFKHGDKIMRARRKLQDTESVLAYWLSGNKYLTFKVLEKYGIRNLPYHKLYSLSTLEEAKKDFLSRNRPVVIKPNAGTSSGKGVTVSITNIKDLNKAMYEALVYDKNFLMEDYIEGDHFRILSFKGNFLGAVKRIPTNLKGNGVSSLDELIRDENIRRAKDKNDTALYQITYDNDMKLTLRELNLTTNYVPKEGEVVYIKKVANLKGGGETWDVTKSVNAKIVEECLNISRIMKISLMGVDLICRDISEPEFYINEVNTTPGISAHIKVINQQDRQDVAHDILKEMFDMEQSHE